MRSRPLMQLLPGLKELVEPSDLGEFPTPLSEEPELARRLGLSSLAVKRDDLASRIYGGSKVRCLEYLLGDAQRSGRSGVVTLGATGSHHALATALFARKLGLRARLVLFPQPDASEAALNAALLPELGAEVMRARGLWEVPLLWLSARTRCLGVTRPYVVPAGGTSALGILGAVEGALELSMAWKSGNSDRPDAVLVPAGSCGTAAGLLLGLALAGESVPLLAVRVAPRVVTRRGRVLRLARAGKTFLRRAGLAHCGEFPELLWCGTQAGQGYALPTEEARLASEIVAHASTIRTDPTYTSKAWAAAREGMWSGRRLLFWNTLSAVDPAAGDVKDHQGIESS